VTPIKGISINCFSLKAFQKINHPIFHTSQKKSQKSKTPRKEKEENRD
jgi:hypothetical protein